MFSPVAHIEIHPSVPPVVAFVISLHRGRACFGRAV